jgi:hypothetical protein
MGSHRLLQHDPIKKILLFIFLGEIKMRSTHYHTLSSYSACYQCTKETYINTTIKPDNNNTTIVPVLPIPDNKPAIFRPSVPATIVDKYGQKIN